MGQPDRRFAPWTEFFRRDQPVKRAHLARLIS
jgi:hypothetical protein